MPRDDDDYDDEVMVFRGPSARGLLDRMFGGNPPQAGPDDDEDLDDDEPEPEPEPARRGRGRRREPEPEDDEPEDDPRPRNKDHGYFRPIRRRT